MLNPDTATVFTHDTQACLCVLTTLDKLKINIINKILIMIYDTVTNSFILYYLLLASIQLHFMYNMPLNGNTVGCFIVNKILCSTYY